MVHKLLTDLFRAGFIVTDPGNGKTIRLSRNCHIQLITAAAGETRALPSPTKEGQLIALVLQSTTNSGTVVVTSASAINTTGNTIMTFDTAGDWCKLESIKVSATAYQWRVVNSDGCALS